MIDLGHGVPPQDVRTGARRLARALPFTPAGVHLAVVDPGVGTPRRALALRAGDRHPRRPGQRPARPAAALRRDDEAVDVGASPLASGAGLGHVPRPRRLRPRRRASGARGAARRAARDRPGELAAPAPRRRAGIVHVVEVDGFGNVVTDGELPDRPRADRRPRRRVGRTFGDVPPGGLVLYEDSSGGRARRQRRQRGGAAGRAHRRRAGAVMSLGRPRVHGARSASTNEARGSSPRRRRARHARHRRRADRRARAPGPQLGDAAGRGDRRLADPARLRRPAAAAGRARGRRRRRPERAVKWPNDVWLDGRKVAGILVEARADPGWAILGIGVNVALDPATLPHDAAAVAGTLGRSPRRSSRR